MTTRTITLTTIPIIEAITSHPEMAITNEMLQGFMFGKYGVMPSNKKINEARQIIKIQRGDV